MSGHVRHDGAEGLIISFDWDPDLVALVKGGLQSRKWDPEARVWRVPATDVNAVIELLAPEGFEFDEVVRGLFDARPPSDDYTVGRLNREAHRALTRAFPKPVWLVGELTGYDKATDRSGHGRPLLFALVETSEGGEPAARIRCRLNGWKREHIERRLASSTTPFQLRDEISVRVRVRVDMYTRTGDFQIDIEDIDPSWTLGEAARRREEVIRRLTADGLLERNARLALGALPLRVGVITSIDSDACADVLRTLEDSGFAFDVVVHGARMQGRSTEASVLNALEHFRRTADALDVVLVVRGGGSRTDLAWFDTEALGRAVATFPLPIVIGIGHEQDRSVLDSFARSAKTPTAAAGLITERVAEAADRLLRLSEDIVRRAHGALDTARDRTDRQGRGVARATRLLLDGARIALTGDERRLGRATTALVGAQRTRHAQIGPRVARAARRQLTGEGERLAQTPGRLRRAVTARLERETERTAGRERRVYLADPARVVERGFAILRGPDGRALRSTGSAPAGTLLDAQLADGHLSLRSEGASPSGACTPAHQADLNPSPPREEESTDA